MDQDFIRQELEKINIERFLRIEMRLDSLDNVVRSSMQGIDEQIRKNINNIEIKIPETTADLTLVKVFEYLGVDINNPDDLKRLQDDLRFGGLFREAATKGFFALLIAICGGVGLSLWLLIKDKFGIQ